MHFHVEGLNCCARCFQHSWLVAFIEEHSKKKGVCRYCGARRAPLIPVSALSSHFANILKVYRPSEGLAGDSLSYLLQDHWRIFNDEFAEGNSVNQLIDDIMLGWWDDDDGDLPVNARDYYVRVHSELDLVEQFEESLQRCLQGEAMTLELPGIVDEDIWRYEANLPAGSTLYRARRGFSGEQEGGTKLPWTGIEEMGANPAGPASRANRAGKVMLYCADKENTAIAEVRPVRGFLVTVAELHVREHLRVLDLLRVSEAMNPFTMEGEAIPYWLSFDELLSRLAWSLASPLERDDTPGDYLPSQLIAQYAEAVGFDGIRYPSAMKAGTSNIVLFNPTVCEFVSSELVKVTEVDIQYTREVWRLSQDYADY